MNANFGNASQRGRGRTPAAASGLSTAAATLLAIALSLAAAPTPAANLDGLEEPYHFAQQDGESLYRAICQACHMPDAEGVREGAGHYPALARNPRLGAAAYVVHNVIHGRYGMPAFGPALDDAQVAAVVNYVRSHFGNRFADAVTAADAKSARADAD